jgi:phosphoglycolate phosphatase-like HAD superfamily hydrolase
MTVGVKKLVLFDIDGTLVLTGGAGIRAMNRAGRTIFGRTELLDGIPVAGRTDWGILDDALRRMGGELTAALMAQFRELYLARLRTEIGRRGTGRKAIMPGVSDLLPALQSRNHLSLGLLTGNFEESARVKLEHFDLWHYFGCGAFGSDAPDRNALVPMALERARECGIGDVAVEDVIVIGDTPHDVACANAVGARPIAVATGSYTVEQLRATGATIVLKDLSDTDEVLRIIESPAR